MVVNHPEVDSRWDQYVRSESAAERLDRNWSNLLQELRVVQTGVQLLTGFLLTLPFQQRFDILDRTMRMVYLATVTSAVGASVLLIARSEYIASSSDGGASSPSSWPPIDLPTRGCCSWDWRWWG